MKRIEKLEEWLCDGRFMKLNEVIDAVNEILAGEPEKLTVRINTHGNPLPECHGEWIDLRTAQDAYLQPLECKRISLGISMEMPAGYHAHILPRSSTCEKYGVILGHSMGVIENDYCGDGDIWGFEAVALKETFIPKGTRLCQFRLVKKAPMVEFDPVESLGNPDRGGWGSTGRD